MANNNTPFIFEIPGRLPGMNDIIGTASYNRYASGTLKKESTNRCAQYVIASRCPYFTDPINLHIKWYEPNAKRDLDNISGGGTKYILDALLITGRIKNDTRNWVRSLTHTFPLPDKINPHIEIIITKEIS
jgi:hypothetical protein